MGRARGLPCRGCCPGDGAGGPGQGGRVSSYWAAYAWLPNGLQPGVNFEVADGRFAHVQVGAAPRPDQQILSGVTLPGLANGHSHAFHRALRGRTQAEGGSFWNWRQQMYALAACLDPDSYFALARAVFVEMAQAGYTVVGEFHYLHHDQRGRRYADPNAMGKALIQAATEAGIRLTLLDTCYLAGGLAATGHLPLDPVQIRFSDGDVDQWQARLSQLTDAGPTRIGTAGHSVRAVPAEALGKIGEAAGKRPLHVHLSEQPAENAVTQAFYGRTPTELLDFPGLLGPRTQPGHAGHRPRPGWDQKGGIDPFEEVRVLELHERLASGERGCFTLGDLIMIASEAGYPSLGWPEGGRIADGASADFAGVRA